MASISRHLSTWIWPSHHVLGSYLWPWPGQNGFSLSILYDGLLFGHIYLSIYIIPSQLQWPKSISPYFLVKPCQTSSFAVETCIFSTCVCVCFFPAWDRLLINSLLLFCPVKYYGLDCSTSPFWLLKSSCWFKEHLHFRLWTPKPPKKKTLKHHHFCWLPAIFAGVSLARELHLVGRRPCGEGQDLIAQADPEDGQRGPVLHDVPWGLLGWIWGGGGFMAWVTKPAGNTWFF